HYKVRGNLRYGMAKSMTGQFDKLVSLLGIEALLDRLPGSLSGDIMLSLIFAFFFYYYASTFRALPYCGLACGVLVVSSLIKWLWV
ncbi:hypothetical protein MJI47_26570, partial [Salmonella enterica subsp. enterica serovar Kentucky]|nr:hypothetical protein [Salmonella enterica subsp. enterica serovar Kentucky]